jgi:hypothetical protein
MTRLVPERLNADQSIRPAGSSGSRWPETTLNPAAPSVLVSGQHRGGGGAGDARHHLNRDAGLGAGPHLLGAVREDERVAALEPDHGLPRPGPVDHQRDDLVVGQGAPSRCPRGVDDLDAGSQPAEQTSRREPVVDDDVCRQQPVQPAHRDQVVGPRSAADEDDAPGRGAGRVSHR